MGSRCSVPALSNCAALESWALGTLDAELQVGSWVTEKEPPAAISCEWAPRMQPCRKDPGSQTRRERAERGVSTWYCADGRCTGRSQDIRVSNTSLWSAESSPGFSTLWVRLWAAQPQNAGACCGQATALTPSGAKLHGQSLRKHPQGSLEG